MPALSSCSWFKKEGQHSCCWSPGCIFWRLLSWGEQATGCREVEADPLRNRGLDIDSDPDLDPHLCSFIKKHVFSLFSHSFYWPDCSWYAGFHFTSIISMYIIYSNKNKFPCHWIVRNVSVKWMLLRFTSDQWINLTDQCSLCLSQGWILPAHHTPPTEFNSNLQHADQKVYSSPDLVITSKTSHSQPGSNYQPCSS